MIPKIIHQIAPKNLKKWHPIWKECQDSWIKQFPKSEFKYILWNDTNDIDNLIKNKFPNYLTLYKSLPFHITKIDFARFCILYEYGGIYADMDMYCYKNFYSYLSEDLYIVESWEEWGEKAQNSLMCSSKNNPFWNKCLEKINEKFLEKINEKFLEKIINNFENILKNDSSNIFGLILNMGGPKMISRILDSSVNLLPKDIFNPMIKNPFNVAEENYTSNLYRDAATDFYLDKDQEKRVMTRHYLTGRWPYFYDE
jgi:hypothetical protein